MPRWEAVGEYTSGVIGFLLIPIEVGGAVPTATTQKILEIQTLKNNTIAALLYLFLKGGGDTKTATGKQVQSPSDKDVTDHPEDNQCRVPPVNP